MRTVYKSDGYKPSQVVTRYAHVEAGCYGIEEVDAKSRTIRRQVVERDELPPGIADECDRWKNQVWNKVRMG